MCFCSPEGGSEERLSRGRPILPSSYSWRRKWRPLLHRLTAHATSSPRAPFNRKAPDQTFNSARRVPLCARTPLWPRRWDKRQVLTVTPKNNSPSAPRALDAEHHYRVYSSHARERPHHPDFANRDTEGQRSRVTQPLRKRRVQTQALPTASELRDTSDLRALTGAEGQSFRPPHGHRS